MASQIETQWMGFDNRRPWKWREQERRITGDFQQFGFRPMDETESPRGCNGCGVEPPTTFVTVYAPGKFDPADAQKNPQASVIGGNDGFFHAGQGTENAVLTWQYAEDAWATVRGRTTVTSSLDRMLELARAVRPHERTPIRLPISMTTMPAGMPLAEINVDHGEYGTRLEFGACGMTDVSGVPPCMLDSDRLAVQIWPSDGYAGHVDEQRAVPVKIGGKDGIYDKTTNTAGVQVQKGMLVVLELSCARGAKPTADFNYILAGVGWPPEPGNDATWPPVSDWAK